MDTNASAKSNDTFGTVFESMIENKNFQKMTIGAKYFYFMCRVQARTNKCRTCLYEHMKDDNTQYNYDNYFVFPAKHLIQSGVDRRNAYRYFKELEQSGFIKKIEKNNHRYKVNVYRFSDEWKTRDTTRS